MGIYRYGEYAWVVREDVPAEEVMVEEVFGGDFASGEDLVVVRFVNSEDMITVHARQLSRRHPAARN
jgi:hypothetical protein